MSRPTRADVRAVLESQAEAFSQNDDILSQKSDMQKENSNVASSSASTKANTTGNSLVSPKVTTTPVKKEILKKSQKDQTEKSKAKTVEDKAKADKKAKKAKDDKDKAKKVKEKAKKAKKWDSKSRTEKKISARKKRYNIYRNIYTHNFKSMGSHLGGRCRSLWQKLPK